MDEGMVGSDKPEVSAAIQVQTAAPRSADEIRHEVQPTVQYAIVPGPARDTFLFYHMEASSKDVNGVWDYCRFCVSNLVWVNDHFVVTPNPCYLNQSSDMEERFAKIKHVLLNWYRAKRMVTSLDVTFN